MTASKLVALYLSIVLLTACSAGTNFKWEDTEKVKPGMSETEVIALLGKPYSRKTEGNRTKLAWSYTSTPGGTKAVGYLFEDGKVVEQTGTVGK